MGSTRFGTVLTAMVTPFSPDGSVDLDVAAALARYLVEQGTEGLVVAGSTGEGSSLSDDGETGPLRLRRRVRDGSGPGGFDVRQHGPVGRVERACEGDRRRGRARDDAGVLAPESGGHHRALRRDRPEHATSRHALRHPCAHRAKARERDHDRTRAKHPNVVALKDASGDLASAPRTPRPYSARTSTSTAATTVLLLPFLAIGAVGIVSVAAHWAGPEFADLVRAAEKGDWLKAQMYNERLQASCAFESSETYPNPLPTKAALRALGIRGRAVPTAAG